MGVVSIFRDVAFELVPEAIGPLEDGGLAGHPKRATQSCIAILRDATLTVNLHSKLTHRYHLKMTHLGGSKAHRRAAPIQQARLWDLLFLVQDFVRDLLWAKR